MSNVKFKNALEHKAQACPPIWFMRQAGRYHQHYQGLRARHSFMELCKNPELAAQVALGPIQDFDFDVSILFSDLLFPLEALGMGLEYTDHGPRLGYKLERDSVQKLGPVDEAIHFMEFQREAVRLTREILPSSKSLIGFVGGPWTLFVYAVEGGHSGSLTTSKSQMDLYQVFNEKMRPLLKANIQLQLDAGAEVVMIFDTAAGEVSPAFFKRWIQPALEELSHQFPGRVGYYSKGTQLSFFDQKFEALPWAGRGYDHRFELSQVLSSTQKGFVQGNFDQALLHMDRADLDREITEWLAPIKNLNQEQRAGWVCGLGHGVLPKTPESNVKHFVDRIRREF